MRDRDLQRGTDKKGMNSTYLIIGCPGSGKTWVCEQLTQLFEYVKHDSFIGEPAEAYVEAILDASEMATKPLLCEAPFSISQIKDPLENAGLTVIPIFILEDEEVIADRYYNRERKPIPQGHLTRQETYRRRAIEWGAFAGTSRSVLQYLKASAHS